MTTTEPNLFFAWFTGLLLACAFQIVLAQFGVAIGLGFTTFLFDAKKPEQNSSAQTPSNHSNVLLDNRSVISWMTGLSLLFTADSVLFVASFLAAKVSMSAWPMQGLVLALAVWATYLLFLFWLSTKAANALGELVFGFVIWPIQQLVQAVQGIMPVEDESREIQAMRALQAEIKAESRQFLQALNNCQRELGDRAPSVQGLADQPTSANAKTFDADVDREVLDMLTTQSIAPDSGWLSQLRDLDWRTMIRSLLEQIDLSNVDAQALWDILQDWLQFDVIVPRNEIMPAEHQTVYDQADLNALKDKIQRYFRYTNLDKLTSSGIQAKVQQLYIERPEMADVIPVCLPSAKAIEQILQRRKGITPLKIQQVIEAIDAERGMPMQATPEAIVRLYEKLSGVEWDKVDLELYKTKVVQIFDYPPTDLQTIVDYLRQMDWQQLIQRVQASQLMPPADADQWLQRVKQLLNNCAVIINIVHGQPDKPALAKLERGFKQSMQKIPSAIAAASDAINQQMTETSDESAAYKTQLAQLKVFVGEIVEDIHDALPTAQNLSQDWPKLYDRLTTNLQKAKSQLEQLRSQLTDFAAHPKDEAWSLIEQVQDDLLKPFQLLEDSLNQTLEQFNQTLQAQLKVVQKLAVVAAWWIFAISISSGLSAACAGWVATGGQLPNIAIVIDQLARLVM